MVWCNYEYAWGGTYQSYYKEQSINGIVIDKDELQPLKFQGQFFDTETSLYYNRFRYYDSDVGMFIQRDPIGLLGGNNVFQYADNPIHWVDPWGLVKNPCNSSHDGDIPPYDDRIRKRAVEDPNGHNFPFSFDKEILKTTPVNVRGGGLGYTLIGSKNGSEYVYNIIVRDGVIVHRDMVSVSKWSQRKKSFGWDIDINEIQR